MRVRPILVMMLVGASAVAACSDDDDDGGGNAGTAGAGGAGGSAGTAGGAGNAGSGGSSSGAGGTAGTGTPPVPPTPALPPGSPTVACGTTIEGALETTDSNQTGRHSRIAPVSACGATKAYPGNGPDQTGPHLFDIYRFSNPTATATCFTFTLTYGGVEVVGDAGADAGDAGAGLDASVPIVADAGDAGDAAAPAPVTPAKYLTAYSTFYPTDLSQAYLGDVGATLTAPQTMGITVPANGTVDVVVYAIDAGPAGVGAYTLSCAQ